MSYDIEDLFEHWVASYDPDNNYPEIEHYPIFVDTINRIKAEALEDYLKSVRI